MAGNSPEDHLARKHDKKRSLRDAKSDERPRKSHRTGSHHSDGLDGKAVTRQAGDSTDLGKGKEGRSAEENEQRHEHSENWLNSSQASEGVSKGHARTPEETGKRSNGSYSDSIDTAYSGSKGAVEWGRRSNKHKEHDRSKATTNGEERPGVCDSTARNTNQSYQVGEAKTSQLQSVPRVGSGQRVQSRLQPVERITNDRHIEAFDAQNSRHVESRSVSNGKTSPYPNTNTDSHSIQSSQADSSIDHQKAATGRPHILSPFWDEYEENNEPSPKTTNHERVDDASGKNDPVQTTVSPASQHHVPSYDDFKPIRDSSKSNKNKQNGKSRQVSSTLNPSKSADDNIRRKKSNSGPAAPLSPRKATQVPNIVTLDEKYPSSTSYANVPGYDHSKPLPPKRKPSQQSDPTKPPPLPPIDEKFMLPVFTHASFVDSKFGSTALETYDRLELLGDAYIEIIATRMLYSRLPDRLVGKISRLREELVCNNSLAMFSALYGFDKRIRPDLTGLLQKQKLQKQKVMGDVFEAYVAAIIESSKERGFAIAEEWLTELWAPILLEKAPDAVSENTKAILQQKLDGYQVRIVYREYRSPQHQGHGETRFFQDVSLTGWGFENKLLGSGWGNSKVIAQMNAAKDALESTDLMNEICEKKRVSEEKRKAVRNHQTAQVQAGGQDVNKT